MSTDFDRRRDLRRALLDGVVDAQLGLQCGGSATQDELARAREVSGVTTQRLLRSSMVR
jgi:hypothetical protein